ncbi:glycosyltransferase family 2 protein [Tropicibacter sp. R16_0]|uniref:glycosyltransferase n=1 Tax=Tropicibacter sp. R16_0 TaxID=2821102 RepID=UPI001ADCB81F|nr:glycosyltransferase [Tropicibacter sp. R16_0]MBO9451647.1 glycosyltransferase family 2 protein [Tropicibacter sp. R16_0]
MSVGLVLIGRNEGDRLKRALDAATGQADRIVYVDSGSTDDSVAAARAAGAKVVELDMSVAFSAARARNAGFARLEQDGAPEFVQFIDGDCALVPGWVEAAVAHIKTDPKLAVITGWRSEIHRNASVYNQMCDHEWHRPAGPITACGGDMLVRADAFRQVGGFSPQVIAAEDDEFCLRLGAAGWRLERLPLEMTRHDAAITRFSQWWRRAVRAGHGFAQVSDLHDGYFRTEKRRVLLFGLILPLVAVLGAAWSIWLPILVLGLYAVSYARTIKGLLAEGLPRDEARKHALFLTLSKFPNLLGMAKYHLNRVRDRTPEIIEYQ